MQPEDAEPTDPFELLGVPVDADARVVKRAYYAKVRQHPPEKEPELFQKIRAAYELLSDPDRRARFLVERSHSAEISRLLEKAEKLTNQSRWSRAALELEKAIEFAPHREHLYAQLSSTWFRDDHPERGDRVIDRWIELDRRSTDPWFHRGALYLARAEATKAQGSGENEGLEKAIAAYMEVLLRNPLHAQALLDLGECHRRLGHLEKAIECTTSMLDIEAVVPELHFEAKIRLGGMYAELEDSSRLDRLIEELEQACRGDDDLAEFLTWRFFQLAAQDDDPEPTPQVLLTLAAAERLVPPSSELRVNLRNFRSYLDASEEIRRIRRDRKLPRAFRDFLESRVYLSDESELEGARGETLTPQDLDRLFLRDCDRMDMFKVRAAVRKIRTDYPISEEKLRDLLEEIYERASYGSRIRRTIHPVRLLVLAIVIGTVTAISLHRAFDNEQENFPRPRKLAEIVAGDPIDPGPVPTWVFPEPIHLTAVAGRLGLDSTRSAFSYGLRSPTGNYVIHNPSKSLRLILFSEDELHYELYRVRPGAAQRALSELIQDTRRALTPPSRIVESGSEPGAEAVDGEESPTKVWVHRVWSGTIQVYPTEK